MQFLKLKQTMIWNFNSTIRSMKWVAIFLFLLANQACTTLSTISFSEVVPASYYIDQRISNVSIVNLAPIQRSPSYHIVLPNKPPLFVDSVWCDDFNDVVLSSFYNDLMSRQFFDSVIIDSVDYNDYTEQLKSNSLSTILDSICESAKSDGVFFVSHSNYASSLFIEPIYDNLFWGYLEARGMARLGFYNSLNKSFEDTYLFTDSLFINGSSGTLNEFNRSLPSPSSFISSVGEKLGHQFVNRYVPYWQSVSREVFKGGNYFFNLGGKAMDSEDWNGAIQAFHFAVDKGSKLTKARAAYNLAVMAEMRGDINSALGWIKMSLELYAKVKLKSPSEIEMVGDYFEKLKTRLVLVDKLSEQLNLEQ